MSFDTTESERPKRRIGLKVALVAAGLAAGAIGATALGANAATTSGSGSTSTSTSNHSQSSTESRPQHMGPMGHNDPGGARPVRSDEKTVSSSVATTLKAAALKAVPGGSVVRVETDSGDAAYEVHMTKVDGSPVTVKFDKNLKETAVEDGMGK